MNQGERKQVVRQEKQFNFTNAPPLAPALLADQIVYLQICYLVATPHSRTSTIRTNPSDVIGWGIGMRQNKRAFSNSTISITHNSTSLLCACHAFISLSKPPALASFDGPDFSRTHLDPRSSDLRCLMFGELRPTRKSPRGTVLGIIQHSNTNRAKSICC